MKIEKYTHGKVKMKGVAAGAAAFGPAAVGS
jgi:hypothetical protein